MLQHALVSAHTSPSSQSSHTHVPLAGRTPAGVRTERHQDYGRRALFFRRRLGQLPFSPHDRCWALRALHQELLQRLWTTALPLAYTEETIQIVLHGLIAYTRVSSSHLKSKSAMFCFKVLQPHERPVITNPAIPVSLAWSKSVQWQGAWYTSSPCLHTENGSFIEVPSKSTPQTLIPATINNCMLYSVGWNNLSIPKLQRSGGQVCEWISNLTPHFIMDVITFSYSDWS